MFYNVYKLPQVQCIASYNDVDYFVVEEKSKFIVKPTFYGDNIEYSYKNYLYKTETFDGTINNTAIDNSYVPIAETKEKTLAKQTEYTKAYFKKREIKEIKLRMSEKIKDKIQEHCADNNISVNQYIMDLIKADLERIAMERAAEDLEQWKEMRQLEEDNGLDEPVTLTALDVDIRDFDNIADAIAEARKRAEEAYGIE